MRRVVISAFVCLFLVAVIECGGRIALGYFDSDGGFHAPDGAFEFGPGSACAGYDAGALTSTAGQWEKGTVKTSIACEASIQCVSALPKGLEEPGFVGSGGVTYSFWESNCVNGDCLLSSYYTPPCTGSDENGDAYCRAFYQQFVAAPNATALASCRPWKEVVPFNHGGDGEFMCMPDCCGYSAFCVQRGNAGPACEFPCQP